MSILLMPKATAVWLVDNTTLTFLQIGYFCNLHELEVQAIADGMTDLIPYFSMSSLVRRSIQSSSTRHLLMALASTLTEQTSPVRAGFPSILIIPI